MKVEKKKRPSIVRTLGFAVALVLVAAFFPFNALDLLTAFAAPYDVNYNVMTIEGYDSTTTSETVTKGADYTLRDAYVGENTGDGYSYAKIGDITENDTFTYDSTTVTMVSSSVTVTYAGNDVTILTTKDDSTVDPYFTASKQGTYTVTYSYTFTDSDSEQHTYSYDLQVESVVSSVSISIPSYSENVLPSIIDLALFEDAVDAGTRTAEIYIPEVEVTDENGDEITDITYLPNALNNTAGNVVVVSVYGGSKAENLGSTYLKDDGDGIYIDSAVFSVADYSLGDYVVTFAYYENGIFINSTTKTFTVYDEYYTDYAIEMNYETDWTDNGETGVEHDLPAATAITADTTSPSGESVDVSYKVEVKFYATDSTSTYAPLSTSVYATYNNETGEDSNWDDSVIYVETDSKGETHTYLCDPTSFKPLEDGTYTFIYTITDFYGNTKTNDIGSLVYENITDETDPTPILYDASEWTEGTDYVDASEKFVTRANANGIIVYAIGMEDNVSSASDNDNGVTLVRKLMSSSSTVKIKDMGYDEYNLVFNYYGTMSSDDTSSDAYSNLLTNNYQLRRLQAEQSATIESDADMLSFLKSNKFLIVIDNQNYSAIYSYFTDVFKTATQNDSLTADDLLTWLQAQTESTLAGIGFAYIDVDQTFGAESNSQTDITGMGTGYFYVHYIATDAAGNETDISYRTYIYSFTDTTSPEITFSTTLKKAYNSTSTITFTAPTATDTIDSNMSVKTFYRYLTSSGTVITDDLKGNDGNDLTESDLKNLYSVWADIEENLHATELYNDYQEDYAAYFVDSSDDDNAGGYIELTDADASSYSIDLSQVSSVSSIAQVQILVYVYDDSGNVAILGKTVNVANSNDQYAPYLKSLTSSSTSTYYQSETITLPTMTITDDAVDYISYKVGVNFVSGTTSTAMTVSGSSATTTKYSMTITGGTFVASYSGDYVAYIAATDDGGHAIIAFSSYTAKSAEVVQEPSFSAFTMEKTQEIEISDYSRGDTYSIDIPTVTYNISNSMIYDEYIELDATDDAETIAALEKVLVGVYADGTVDFNTGYGSSSELDLYALGLGDHKIVYTADILSYDLHEFVYSEETYTPATGDYTEGGYFTLVTSGSNFNTANVTKIVANVDGSYVVTVDSTDYLLEYDSTEEEWNFYTYTNGEKGESALGTDTVLNETTYGEISLITNGIKLYHLVSDTYTISIVDTVKPELANYNYTAIAKSDVTTEYLPVYGIEATDEYGLDIDECSIVISCTLSTGSKTSETLSGSEAFVEVYEGYTLSRETTDVTYDEEADPEHEHPIYDTLIDGTYKIVYTVVDLAGNTTTATYTIAVGDNTAPTITIEDDFVESSYEIGTVITLDLTKISFSDASGIDYDSITYTLTDSSGEEITATSSTTGTNSDGETVLTSLTYDIEDVDTYTFTIYVEDNVSWSTEKTVEFTVEAKSTDSTSVYQIVGIVLIVVSVLVLAGVIIYFIVAKVKLDKELKK